MNNTRDISLDEDFQNRIHKFEIRLSSLAHKSPSMLLGMALGTGVIVGYFGLKNIIKAGMWLKANEQIPYSKIFKNVGVEKKYAT